MNNRISDVLIHTKDELTDEQFKTISKSVYAEEGVVSFSRNECAPKFLILLYQVGKTRAANVLDIVKNGGFQATLVGI